MNFEFPGPTGKGDQGTLHRVHGILRVTADAVGDRAHHFLMALHEHGKSLLVPRAYEGLKQFPVTRCGIHHGFTKNVPKDGEADNFFCSNWFAPDFPPAPPSISSS